MKAGQGNEMTGKNNAEESSFACTYVHVCHTAAYALFCVIICIYILVYRSRKSPLTGWATTATAVDTAVVCTSHGDLPRAVKDRTPQRVSFTGTAVMPQESNNKAIYITTSLSYMLVCIRTYMFTAVAAAQLTVWPGQKKIRIFPRCPKKLSPAGRAVQWGTAVHTQSYAQVKESCCLILAREQASQSPPWK